jgi:hypothetical protein
MACACIGARHGTAQCTPYCVSVCTPATFIDAASVGPFFFPHVRFVLFLFKGKRWRLGRSTTTATAAKDLTVCVCTFVIVIISRFESSGVRRKDDDDDDEDLIDFCCWAATMELKYQSAWRHNCFHMM